MLFAKKYQNLLLENQKLKTKKLFTEANDKSGKQFLNFISARNKRKHDKYELDDIGDTIYFSPASVKDEIKEQIVPVTTHAVVDTVKDRSYNN